MHIGNNHKMVLTTDLFGNKLTKGVSNLNFYIELIFYIIKKRLMIGF